MQSLNALPWVPGLPFSALSFREIDDSIGQPQIPSPFTEFYCTSGGSNLNAGSTTSNAAIYTSTNGGWSTVTNIFTPADGSNPIASGVSSGMFASIFLDAATVAVYIARITLTTDAANGGITLSSTVIYGTAPTTAASGITIKVGGAWLGPTGAITAPFGLSGTISVLVNASNNQVRVNVKNDQTYTMTAALPFTTLGVAVLQGYTTNPGDLGKATFTSNITSGTNFTNAASRPAFIDLIFANTGASGTNHLFSVSTASGSDNECIRCVFHGARGHGATVTGTGNCVFIECEAYDNNKSNSASNGGFQAGSASGGMVFCYHCYSHDNTGTNASGFLLGGNSNGLVLIECISESNGGHGVLTGGNPGGILVCIGCNIYNNAGDGIRLAYTTANTGAVVFNNNFVINCGMTINNTVTSQGGIMYNNGRMGNVLADTLKSIVNTNTDKFYPDGITPWNAPDSGDFSTVLAAAIGTGRGAFTETDGTNTGTVSYPDIGAAQSQPFTQSWAGEDYVLPVGYLNHTYEIDFTFNSTVAISLTSGSLPTGLALSTVSPTQAKIIGTPTVIATSNFTLRSTVGASTGDATFHITVNDDPDEGVGAVGGG